MKDFLRFSGGFMKIFKDFQGFLRIPNDFPGDS